jgi:hypothetical protein
MLGAVAVLSAILLFPSAQAFTITGVDRSSQETRPQHETPPRIISVTAKDFDFEP